MPVLYVFFLSLLYCSISNKSHDQTRLLSSFASIRCFIFHHFSQKPLKNCWTMTWWFTCYFWDTRVFDLLPYHISTTSASMLTLSAVVRGVKTLSGQTKDYNIGLYCCFSVKHAVFRSKSKDWFSQNQVYESKWSDMSTRWLFQWTGTIKI